MPLQSVESGSRSLSNEFFLQLFAGKPERHVHQRTATGLGVRAVERARVKRLIKNRGFLLITTGHLLQTTVREKPLQHEPHYVNGKSRRRVVQRFLLRVSIVV